MGPGDPAGPVGPDGGWALDGDRDSPPGDWEHGTDDPDGPPGDWAADEIEPDAPGSHWSAGADAPGSPGADRAGGAGADGLAGAWAAGASDWLGSAEDRTEELVSHGRPSAYRPGLSRVTKTAIGAAVAGALITVVVVLMSGGGGSWPASVAVMERQAGQACRNPDVRSEPAQVNFACARNSRQVLWVFALLTSGGNPGFRDASTGRVGLEPITPAQGGQLAWSLNLHHPYRPSDPVDSLQVAARAINNIIGGATLTGSDGKLVIQSGLEGNPANCLRYTGSAAVTVRNGFPRLCTRPVTTAGRAALVADVYRKWVVGSPAATAQAAAVLFANADHPANPQVQAILRHLPRAQVSP
ncbi:MAG: hypothetical protein J2P35_06830 [Actinobacteria bacterium]|nr:hypothetical protein [Actinomycetota bacterium]